MAEETDIVEASIVVVGSFNPAIFSPAWFRLNNLITDGQLEAAELNVVHPQVSQFAIDHLRVTVEPNKMTLQITTDPVVKVADLVVKILRDLLPHVPVTAVGVNYGEHWRLDTWQRRVVLGRALAPLEPWGEWGASFKSDDRERVSGLIQLIMKQPFADGTRGHKQVQIEPSSQLADKHRGVHLMFNHHQQLDDEGANGNQAVAQLLEEKFGSIVGFARNQIAQFRKFTDALEV